MPARVETGSRLHAGFLNLSLTRERIYGGIGVGLAEPQLSVVVEKAESLSCPDADAAVFARRSLEVLGLAGAAIEVESSLPRHVGLGSGTQLALAVHAGIGAAYEKEVDVRSAAPALDRGGRSGVGVAVFERGGFIVDAGHPTERFTTDRPPRGEWSVPPVSVRHEVPDDWRFVLVRPEVSKGRSGEEEDQSMRSIVEEADPDLADEIAGLVTGRLLPAIADGDHVEFGAALADIGRRNGAWYAGEQGGLYRPPVGPIVEKLDASSAIAGAGQSSWGPTVYGVTHVDSAESAADDAAAALEVAGLRGSVQVVEPTNRGASIEQV